MDVKNLLKPRFKVLADWPSNYPLKVGDTIDMLQDEDGIWFTYHHIDFDKYPHLFKKLQWWEERKEDEMPEYVRNKESGKVRRLSKFLKDYNFFLNEFLPATQSEYENQKQTA